MMRDANPLQIEALIVRPEVQRDRAGGIGLQREMNEIVPLLLPLEHFVIADVVLGWRVDSHLRLGLLDPLLILLQSLLGFSDRRHHQIYSLLVGGAKGTGKRPCLIADAVEDAPARLQFLDLVSDFRWRAVYEQLAKHTGRLPFRWNFDALTVPR